MSRYKPYPQYKDSGVEWLGEVPENWDVKPLKFIAELNPKKSEIQNKEDIDCSFVPMEKLKTGKIDLDLVKPISDVYDGYTYFRNNDILLAKVTPCFENRNIAIASNLCNEIGFGSSEIYVIRVYNQSEKKYLFYSLQEETFIELAVSQMTGVGGLKRIPSEFLANLKFPFPSFEEQQSIAHFLDNATCKIDTLIQKQQNLIELLKEKRQALIFHAVTKGLNPHVKIKNSGVEWLGEVPEHWNSVCLKWIAKIYSGGTPDKTNLSYWEEGTIPWISSGEVNQFFITEPTTYITQEAYEKSSAKWIPKNALVMALAGQGKTKGMVAQLGIMTTCNQSMAAIVLSENVSERFIFWWLTSNYEKIRNLAGGDLRDGLNLDIIGSIVCPYFLLSEQQQIANYLDNATCKINTLISKAQQAIELLKERRTALISATVTGKIDVRSSNGR